MSASQKVSTESAILSALSANNPFERPPVVKEQNIWGESFPDIPLLNANASNSVFDALEKVRTADSSLEKVTSVVFTADRGVGKSHVIKRIRQRLQASSEGVFIYASADRYGDLNLINALFQQSLAESLEQQGGEGVTQWQEIATLIVAEALSANNASARIPAASTLVKRFDQIHQKTRAKGKDLVRELSKVIRKIRPGIDPYILRALIWTLSEERGSLAVKWLAGEQIEAQDAIDLRLPPNNKTEAEVNAAAPSTVAELVSLIGEYRSVVVCFDELDTIAADDNGFTTSFVVLDLVKRLFDSVSQSEKAKGVLVLSVLLPDLWRQVTQTKFASAEKLSSYSKPIGLEYLKPETTYELCATTLKQFYGKKGLVPPTPIYPFEAAEIEAFGKVRPSAREGLQRFAELLNQRIKAFEPPVSPTERFERAYKNALTQFDSEDLNSNEHVALALRFGFQKILEIEKIKDQPIEGVIITGIEDIVPKSKNNGRLHFKIVGEEDGEPVVIGLGAVQDAHGLSVGAAFRRLLDTETFGLSRGCLVRSRDLKIKRNWDSFEYYQQLVAAGGEWVDLLADEIKPLVALQYVYEHCDKFDLTVKRLNSFAFTRNLLQSSPILKEILSRPAGTVVEEALEGDERQALNTDINPDDIEADLSDVLSVDDVEPETDEVKADLEELAVAV
ncbi:MAG: P-loop NTPase fold protein [Cyanobacteria bacterium P01_D01_bin.1]